MPQLVKGGKWVFSWVKVGPEGELPIPGDAWAEYGFRAGEEALFLRGSRTSGGFGLSTPRLLTRTGDALQRRILDRSRIEAQQWVTLPAELGVSAGARLLAVRGSGRALGFVAQGPIYDEALRHPELAELRVPSSA
jgi:hypothetical protein